MAKAKFENEYTYKRMLESGREDEFDRLFDEAAENVRDGFGAEYPMYISGEAVRADSLLIEKSPMDSQITIGKFQKGTREHAKLAIDAAQGSFEEWCLTDYRKRVSIIRKAADLLSKDKYNIAAILSYENAKSRYESMGEVDEAVDFMRYYSNEMEANRGYVRKSISKASKARVAAGFQGAPSSQEKVTISLRPYGVFGVIAPFNFPISISTGMSVGALITGNTVVFKPSSSDNMTMLTGLKIYELLKEAGVPGSVFNYVTGPGSEVGDELATNDNVAGIAFTGSRSTGMSMISRAFSSGKQKAFIVEMGGKNPAIVSKHADLDAAVNGVASAAFGFAGQKCSALSRVYVHQSKKELFVSKLIEKARNLKVGNPLDKENYIGPLISKSAFDRYTEAIQKARSTGGRILYGGNPVKTGFEGYYVEPAIIEARHDSELVKKELFAPILTLETYSDFGEAIRMANDVEYGLTAGLYSKNRNEIAQFSNDIQAGVVYINREISATTGAIVGLHTFVGWKGSGLTGKGTGSKNYLQQFMREQSLSVTK